jgi:hypothetical protein
MSSIKQLIVNAIVKVTGENPSLNGIDQPTAEQARDDFIRLLLAELFPEDPAVPSVVAVKEKKAKKPKAKVEPVVVEKAVDVVVSDPDGAPAAEPVPVPDVVVPVAESPKKKRAPMSDEAKAAMKAKKEATLAAKKAGGQPVSPPQTDSVLETFVSNAAAGGAAAPEPIASPVKEKKPPKPKGDKPNKDANLPKVDPTWKKHLKHADKDHAKELEPALLTYLNALSKEDFNAKKAEEHVADFIASRVTKAVESDGKVEADLDVVEFEGKEYYVNPETKRVYEGEGTFDDETGWTNYKPVGYVGMAAFADMKIE